ncbi:hypothetical protein LJR015_004029 [Peribacillus frigoritolerans]
MDKFEIDKMVKGIMDKPKKNEFEKLEKQVEVLNKKVEDLERRLSAIEK